jgi:hypothetical protein
LNDRVDFCLASGRRSTAPSFIDEVHLAQRVDVDQQILGDGDVRSRTTNPGIAHCCERSMTGMLTCDPTEMIFLIADEDDLVIRDRSLRRIDKLPCGRGLRAAAALKVRIIGITRIF